MEYKKFRQRDIGAHAFASSFASTNHQITKTPREFVTIVPLTLASLLGVLVVENKGSTSEVK